MIDVLKITASMAATGEMGGNGEVGLLYKPTNVQCQMQYNNRFDTTTATLRPSHPYKPITHRTDFTDTRILFCSSFSFSFLSLLFSSYLRAIDYVDSCRLLMLAI